MHRLRPVRRHLGGEGAHRGAGLHDVLAGAANDLERIGGIAIIARETVGILEGAAHMGDVLQCHHGIAGARNRQFQRILGAFEQAGHLDLETRLRTVQSAGGDEAVVGLDRVEELAIGDPVAFQQGGIDGDFQHFLAQALDVDLEDLRQRLQLVLEIAGEPVERAFRRIAEHLDGNSRGEGGIEFLDDRLARILGEFPARHVDRLAYIEHGLVGIEGNLEFRD